MKRKAPAEKEKNPVSDTHLRTALPRLRFPGFEGEWEETVLEPYIDLFSKRVSSDTDLPVYSSTRSGLIAQKEYYDGRELINDGEYGIVPDGYFVYRHMSDDSTFKFNINRTGVNIAVSKEYPVFKAKNMDSFFLLYLLNDGSGFKKFSAMQKKGGTRTRLYFSTLCALTVFLPKIIEQQKIAECLTSLDELIIAHNRKMNALRLQKKGLLRKIFPTEGETVPFFRFSDFHNDGAWSCVCLGDTGEILDNKRIPITERERISGTTPYYGASGIVDYVDGYIFDETVLCISEDGANLLSRNYPIAFSVFGKSWINNHVHVMKFSNNETRMYIEYFLNYIDLNNYITGIAQPKLNQAMLDIIPVFLPSLPEQQKIAECLSSLDSLIAAETKLIESLKMHKKGLMQALFPDPDEVNA